MNKPKDSKKTAKKNVQVAVRLRPMNDTEYSEHGKTSINCDTITKIISTTNGKSFGAFDKCYGQESTQQEIYLDLVSPLIKEVLEGYNCTVFAYGQTGTGKTFTMEGSHDETEDYSWDADPKAGIIPRALHHIFSELTSVEDYCVRVSYVELYNEELYDLLGTDTPGAEQQKLRIFDDKAHGNGVLINNLTEMTVRNRNEVYALLKKGAERRRTAATLMNMNSSRSHSVFTVNVMFRDNAVKSEELILKTGKLNLVDLAGSENIGKSGSTASRAREAGNINQSLLTLGRVITSLTSNAGHIPYRESKLTRILQDSLGGKTITTIIATLSPSSTSLEESISTLEYAQRAKNIKNSPEINAQITRKALLREYSDEIERLRRDLIAARQKNGIFLAQENYDEMQEQIKENNSRIEDLETQLQATVVKFQQIVDDFEFMDQQYCLAYEKHLEALRKLNERMDELRMEREERHKSVKKCEAAKVALEQSENETRRLFAQAQQVNEYNIILGNELESLHEKHLECKRIFETNSKLLGTFSANQIGGANKMKSYVKNFEASSKCNIQELKEFSDDLRDVSMEKLRNLMLGSSNIHASITNMSEELKNLSNKHVSTAKEDVEKCNQVVISFLNKNVAILSDIQELNKKQTKSLEEFDNLLIKIFEKQEKESKMVKDSAMKHFNNGVSKIEDYKMKMKKMFEELEEHNEISKQFVQTLVDKQSEATQEVLQGRNKNVDKIKKLPKQIECDVETLSVSNNDFTHQINEFAEKVYDDARNLNKFDGEVHDNINNEMDRYSQETSEIIQEFEHNIEATSLSITNALNNHCDVDLKLVNEVTDHLEVTQQSMERFVHQEFHHYRSGGTPIKKKRVFGVELVEPSTANQLYSEAESKMSPIKQIIIRESILASDSHHLLSPKTIKAQLAAKKIISMSPSDENMQVE